MTETAMGASVPESAPVSAPESAPVRHKVKIDGQELEVDHEELVRGYQKASSADKRFREAAALKSEAEKFLGNLSSKDLAWLKKQYPKEDLKKFAEDFLIEELEWAEKPEVERRAITAEKELEKLRKEAEEKSKTEIRARAAKEVEDEIMDAIKDLPYKADPELIAAIAEEMLANLSTGAKIPAKDAVTKAMTRAEKRALAYLKTLDAQKFRQLMPDFADSLRKSYLDEVKGQDPMRKRVATSDEAPVVRKKAKAMSTEDMFKNIEKKFGG